MNLKSNDSVAKMLRLMEESGRVEQVEEMKRLIACTDSTEEQYSAVLQKLGDIKSQLATELESQDNYARTFLALEDQADVIHRQLNQVREKVISRAENTISGIKQTETSALDAVMWAWDLKDTLEFIQDMIWSAMTNTGASTRMRTLNSMYADINRTLYGALGAVERLGRMAEKNTVKHKNPSVHRRLKEKKADAPERALSASARKPREVSR